MPLTPNHVGDLAAPDEARLELGRVARVEQPAQVALRHPIPQWNWQLARVVIATLT